MKINGHMVDRLEVEVHNRGYGVTGLIVERPTGRISRWILAESGGHTTHFDFHGRRFVTREAAESYIEGFNQAVEEIESVLPVRTSL